MTNKQNNVVSFRSTELKTELLSRGISAGEIASRDLDRYYLLLQWELSRLKLTREEALLLCDVFNGTLNDFRFNPVHFLWLNCQDAIDLNQTDKKWNIDGSVFLERLKSFSILQAAAVLDAVERFWHEPNYQIPDTEAKAIAVGLYKPQTRLIMLDAISDRYAE